MLGQWGEISYELKAGLWELEWILQRARDMTMYYLVPSCSLQVYLTG